MMRTQKEGPHKMPRKHSRATIFTAVVTSPAGSDPGHGDVRVLTTEKQGFSQLRNKVHYYIPGDFLNVKFERRHPLPRQGTCSACAWPWGSARTVPGRSAGICNFLES